MSSADAPATDTGRVTATPPHPTAVTVAERTRTAVDARPFLRDALAAGVVNYAAAAAALEPVSDDADTDAVTAALRRYADELSLPTRADDARVRVRRGFSLAGDGDPLLAVGEERLVADDGALAVVLAVGTVTATGLERLLGRLRAAEVSVTAAAVVGETLLVAVPRRASATALRAAEAALSSSESA